MFRILLVALLLLSPACKKVSDPKQEDKVAASRPVTVPSEVMATLQLPSGTSSEGLMKLVDNVQPGASGMLSAQMPALFASILAMDLSAADLAGPVSILFLDVEKFADPFAVLIKSDKSDALLQSAEEAGKLGRAKGGLVLLGSAKAVSAVEAFAFATLAKPSSELVGVVYPKVMVAAFQKKFDELREQMKRGMAGSQQGPVFEAIMGMYKEMFSALGEQSERLVITIGTEGKSSDLYIRLYPKAGTTMEAFANAQVPSDYDLLARLPAGDSSMLMAGEMRMGAAREAFMAMGTKMMTAMYSSELNEAALASLTRIWMDTLDGRVAATMDMSMAKATPVMSLHYLMGATTDASETQAAWRELMKAFSSVSAKPNMMGMNFIVDFKENVRSYDSVEIDSYKTTLDPSSVDAAQVEAMGPMTESTVYLASFDKLAAMSMAMGEGESPSVDNMIAAARGKAPGFVAQGAMADVIAQSRRKKESVLMAFDVASIARDAAPMVPFSLISIGLGKEASGALVMRMSIVK